MRDTFLLDFRRFSIGLGMKAVGACEVVKRHGQFILLSALLSVWPGVAFSSWFSQGVDKSHLDMAWASEAIDRLIEHDEEVKYSEPLQDVLSWTECQDGSYTHTAQCLKQRNLNEYFITYSSQMNLELSTIITLFSIFSAYIYSCYDNLDLPISDQLKILLGGEIIGSASFALMEVLGKNPVVSLYNWWFEKKEELASEESRQLLWIVFGDLLLEVHGNHLNTLGFSWRKLAWEESASTEPGFRKKSMGLGELGALETALETEGKDCVDIDAFLPGNEKMSFSVCRRLDDLVELRILDERINTAIKLNEWSLLPVINFLRRLGIKNVKVVSY